MRNIWADCRDKYWLGAFAGNGKWYWEPGVVFMWLRCGIKTAGGSKLRTPAAEPTPRSVIKE